MNDNKYLGYFKKGFLRYIPEFLIPSIKPKIIDNILIEEKIVGKVVGINLKPFDPSYKSNLDIYLMAIKELKEEDDTKLFIEGQENFNKETLDYIQEFTGMKILDGENTRIKSLSLIVREIYTLLKEDIQEKEVLIICSDKDKTKRLIKSIAKDLRFITAIGYGDENHEEVYEYILEETGLSLFYTSNIDRILENYSIIINLMDNVSIDFSKARRNCIIFNFVKDSFSSNTKRPPFIEDFAFDLEDLCIDGTGWLNNKVHSSLFEGLIEDKAQNAKYIYAGNNYYTIKDYINLYIKIKGKL